MDLWIGGSMEKDTCGGRVLAGLGVGGGRFMVWGGD
jgi:hypothetical protein